MILMKDIIREGHPTLTKVAQPVKMPVTLEDRNIAFSLLQYVMNSQDDEIAEKIWHKARCGISCPTN